MALGEAIRPDYRALPRATYTDPEAASVGLTLDQAREAGLDAFECVADFTTSSKGYSVEADTGHVTIVVDRATRELVGAAMACPDASAAIHECVVAIKAHVMKRVGSYVALDGLDEVYRAYLDAVLRLIKQRYGDSVLFSRMDDIANRVLTTQASSEQTRVISSPSPRW